MIGRAVFLGTPTSGPSIYLGEIEEVSVEQYGGERERFTLTVAHSAPRHFLSFDESAAADIAATVPGAAGW